MILRPQGRELLRSYLLGTASAAECEEVEESYFSDYASVGELLRAEDELIDDYVRGELTPGERALFEKNFLCTRDRRQRLESVQVLAEALASLADESPDEPQRTRGRAGGKSASQPRRPRARLAPGYAREPFGNLLELLDPAPERAAEKYENIRRGLVKIFASRGYSEADELADVTMDRVAQGASKLTAYGGGDPAHYFYGVARMVLREQERRREVATMLPPVLVPSAEESDETEQAYQCLEECLGRLSAGDREMLLDYYRPEGRSKVADRKNLAENLGISLNALRLRAYRVRTSLRNCVTSCLEQAKDRN